MGQIICIVSLKGGVGKTTTAVNLAAAMALVGKKVLLIDGDPQGSATTAVGIGKKNLGKTLYDVFTGNAVIDEVILDSPMKGLKVVPVHAEFFRVEFELMGKKNKETILKKSLADVRSDFDYIIIDTPPSLGLISINSMVAADYLVVPMQCEYPAYESLIQLLKFIRLVKNKMNPRLELAGIVLTMHDIGEKMSRKIVNSVRNHLDARLFRTIIPRSVEVREAAGIGKPLLLQDPESIGAKTYQDLAGEVIRRTSGGVRTD